MQLVTPWKKRWPTGYSLDKGLGSGIYSFLYNLNGCTSDIGEHPVKQSWDTSNFIGYTALALDHEG